MDSVNKSLRPVARPRSKTGEETKYGRPMWEDETTGDLFSEKTVTVPYGDGFVVMPSVAEDGSELTEDQIFDYVRRNGPVDFMTGEKLPIFESMEEADAYAQKRSETMFTDEDPTPRMDDSMSDMGSEEDGTSMMDVGKSILKLGIAGAQLAGKKMGMDIYPTEDNPYGFAEGGLAMDRQMRTFMAEGGLKDDGMNIDPVSGNEIPPGSMAEEVRDDISAQLSEGEYVVPADVVKYFGVKFFEELRSEAKSGLGQMEANGRIGGEPVPTGGPRGGGNMMNDVTGGLTVEEMAQLEAVMTQGGAGMGMAVGGVVPQQYGMPMAQPQSNTGMMQQGMQVGGVVKGYQTGGLEQEMETIQSYNTFDPSEYSLGYSFRPQEQQQAFVLLYGPNGEVVSLMLPRDQAEFQRLAAQGYTTEQPGLLKEEEAKKPEDDFGGMADGGQESPFGGPAASLGDLNDVNNDGKVDFADTFLGDLLGLDGKIGVQGPGLKASLQGARRSKSKDTSKSTSPTSTSTTGTGFQSRDTDSIGRDFSGSGISMGEVFGGDGRGSTSTAPEGFGLGKSGSGISTAPSTTGMSMGETDPGDGRGVTGTAPEGFGIGGGESAPSPDAPGPDAPGPDAPGPSGSTAGGVSADTADDGTVGDIGALMNKGGLAAKRRKPKRNTASMAKGGLASPKKK